MRMRLIRKSIKNIWQIIVIVWLVFAYQLMLNMVPDEVKLIDGDLSKLDISMPVTFECRDSGKRFIDTSVMENQQLQSSMDKAGAERNEIDMASDTVVLRAKLFGIIPIKEVQADIVAEQEVYASGENIGIYVQTDGIFVIGTGNFEGMDGVCIFSTCNQSGSCKTFLGKHTDTDKTDTVITILGESENIFGFH